MKRESERVGGVRIGDGLVNEKQKQGREKGEHEEELCKTHSDPTDGEMRGGGGLMVREGAQDGATNRSQWGRCEETELK